MFFNIGAEEGWAKSPSRNREHPPKDTSKSKNHVKISKTLRLCQLLLMFVYNASLNFGKFSNYIWYSSST